MSFQSLQDVWRWPSQTPNSFTSLLKHHNNSSNQKLVASSCLISCTQCFSFLKFSRKNNGDNYWSDEATYGCTWHFFLYPNVNVSMQKWRSHLDYTMFRDVLWECHPWINDKMFLRSLLPSLVLVRSLESILWSWYLDFCTNFRVRPVFPLHLHAMKILLGNSSDRQIMSGFKLELSSK